MNAGKAMTERAIYLAKLRTERNRAAARGDHAEALILNDRIIALKKGGGLVVERIMQQFESGLARRRTYGPRSTH